MRAVRLTAELLLTHWLFYAVLAIPAAVQQIALTGGVRDWAALGVLIPGVWLVFLLQPLVLFFWTVYVASRILIPMAAKRLRAPWPDVLGIATGVCLAWGVALAGEAIGQQDIILWSLGDPTWIPLRLTVAAASSWLIVYGAGKLFARARARARARAARSDGSPAVSQQVGAQESSLHAIEGKAQ
jgi:hypothetical protein